MNLDRNYVVEFFIMWLKVGGVYLIGVIAFPVVNGYYLFNIIKMLVYRQKNTKKERGCDNE